MQHLNPYRFYELAAKLHGLFSSGQNRVADMFAPLTETQTALDALKAAIAKNADHVHDRRLIEILDGHIRWKERDFRALEIGARRARARIDETLVAQGLRPARSHE